MSALVLRREVPTVWEDPDALAAAVWLTLPWYRRLFLRLLGRGPWA